VYIPDRWHIALSRETPPQVDPASSCSDNMAVGNSYRAVALLVCIRGEFQTCTSRELACRVRRKVVNRNLSCTAACGAFTAVSLPSSSMATWTGHRGRYVCHNYLQPEKLLRHDTADISEKQPLAVSSERTSQTLPVFLN